MRRRKNPHIDKNFKDLATKLFQAVGSSPFYYLGAQNALKRRCCIELTPYQVKLLVQRLYRNKFLCRLKPGLFQKDFTAPVDKFGRPLL